MILDEIVLRDFGVYAGQQAITLTPPTEHKPVVLFGGLNGGGKTTLLDAIQLCMFGPFAQCSTRGKLGYQEFLRRCVHRHTKSKEAGIELAFRHRLDGKEQNYRLLRSWRVNRKGVRERFEVIRNGTHDPTLSENWIYQVQDFLPSNIAHLFLFDGEKIEGYANGNHSARLIGSAIENLLGLDIVDQLNKDLVTLDRRKRTAQQDEKTRAQLKSVENDLRLSRSHLDKLIQKRAVRGRKLEHKHKALAAIENRYRKLGGKLYDQRQTIESQKDEAADHVEAGKAVLRELATGDLPLLLANDLLASLAERDNREEAGRLTRDVLSTLEERDAKFMKEFRKLLKSATLVKKIEQLHAKDRESRKGLAETEIYLALSVKARACLSTLRAEALSLALRNSQALLDKQKRLEAHLEHMQTNFDSIPASDTLAALIKEREQMQKEITAAQTELNSLDASLARLKHDIERKELMVDRLLKTVAETRIADKERIRILAHMSKVRDTLKRFRKSVIQRHVKRIENLVLLSYQQLLRKTSLVARLTIDPDNFGITMYGKSGHQRDPERLSAGERQLLGVALLWGLARASGRPLPTAIDAPLGRLDTAHRSHLVERYLPFASHQVLLLSTDEEIVGDYLKKLEPWIGRYYQLEFDVETGSTQVLPGYFEDMNAAHVH